MKKILLSSIYFLTFHLILDKKRVIKKITIYMLINFCIIANGYSQTLDLSYGTEGKVLIPSSSDVGFFGGERGSESGPMALQNDGKLLIAHNATKLSTGRQGFALIRLNSDGRLDNTFSNDGIAFTEIFSSSSSVLAKDISIAPDGKIVVTGNGFVTLEGINYYAFIASRFNTDGTPDNSLDGDGTLILNESVILKASVSVAIQRDGKILLAGNELDPLTNFHYKVVRLNTNGTLDNSFGIGGILIGPEGRSGATKIRLQSDGKI